MKQLLDWMHRHPTATIVLGSLLALLLGAACIGYQEVNGFEALASVSAP